MMLNYPQLLKYFTALVILIFVPLTGYTQIINESGFLEIEARDVTGTFGSAVAADGDVAVIGAPLAFVSGVAYGRAYVYTRNNEGWTETAVLLSGNYPQSGGGFGTSVGIDGNTIVVGANRGPGTGSVLVFTNNGGDWTKQAELVPEGAPDFSAFGSSVAIDGDTVVAGAENESGIGAAYVFTRTGTTWTEQVKLEPPNGVRGAFFGASIAVSGDTVMVSSTGAPTNSNVLVGNDVPGSVYVFTRKGSSWT